MGIKKHGYPTRQNARGVDLNRSFYQRRALPGYRSQNETEFVLDLLFKFRPEYWIIPHSSLNLLDLDGPSTPAHLLWVKQVHSATTTLGAPAIPIKNHRVYAPPRGKKGWSIGKLAQEMGQSIAHRMGKKGPGALTIEFGGPGPYPARNDPQRALKISHRKHLGRYSDNTHIADGYYHDYRPALLSALQIPAPN